MIMEVCKYTQQANKFLSDTNTTFEVSFLRYGKHFTDDKESRDIYAVKLTRGSRSYSFNFGQSLNCSMQWVANTIYARNACHKLNYPRLIGNSKREMCVNAGLPLFGYNDNDFTKNSNYSEPTAYDVLTCLTTYDPESLENFCDEFGYDLDSKAAEVIYLAVQKEYDSLCTLFNDEELEMLSEIQ